MKTIDMTKENNFVLREAAKAASMGYYDHLAAGGKGDPAEERWIEALAAGADAITQVSVLEQRLVQAEEDIKHLLIISNNQRSCAYCSRYPGKCDLCETDAEWRGTEEDTE